MLRKLVQSLAAAVSAIGALSVLTSAQAEAGTHVMDNVPLFHQAYPLSCEAASLRMALAREGIGTTDEQILELTPTDPRPAALDSGVMHWGDPYATYVGDVNGSEVRLTGYGTYYPTIAQAATGLGGHVLRAGEQISPSDVYAAINADHPVVAWVTYLWAPATRHDYVAFDGRSIPFAGPVEHSVTLIGTTSDSVLVQNPMTGQEWVAKSVFEASFSTYNNMAVIME
jgi:uncharacterized protein YvpB